MTEQAEQAKLPERLREACAKLRTRPIPLSDMIPLMQEAADAIERAEQDAKRYRWLRENSTQPAEPWSTHSGPESLDEVVDAAIRATPKEPEPGFHNCTVINTPGVGYVVSGATKEG